MPCFACGRALDLGAGERVGFRDACSGCDADLHVCRGCRFHDLGAYNECRESSAERVLDKECANRCDYFAPREGAAGAGALRGRVRGELDRLFRK